MTPPARALWRFLRREGDTYVFAARRDLSLWPPVWSFHRVPVGQFWGGAR